MQTVSLIGTQQTVYKKHGEQFIRKLKKQVWVRQTRNRMSKAKGENEAGSKSESTNMVTDYCLLVLHVCGEYTPFSKSLLFVLSIQSVIIHCLPT